MHFPLSQVLLISLSILPSLVTSAPVAISSPEASPEVYRPSWKRTAEPEPEVYKPSWRREADSGVAVAQINRPSWKREEQGQNLIARWSAVVPPNKYNRSPEHIVY